MGIASVGHRLTILKAVYEVKVKQNVAIEEDDYVPLCECSPFYSSNPTAWKHFRLYYNLG